MTAPEWLSASGNRALAKAFETQGHQLAYVGGCVRNWVMGRLVTDMDLATSATPHQMMELAETHSLKAIPTGFDHGTVTFVLEGVPFEVTTFRRDVETDGRHATVAFSTSLEEDARRRDFTMNALYLSADGTLIDPLGGVEDARAGRVRFIGKPEDRITEDALRILRFFRFFAQYGDPSQGIDAEGLAACAANWAMLEPISKERITAELLKLLGAADPAPAIAALSQSGGLSALLPGADDRFLAPLVHFEGQAGCAQGALSRLAILGGTRDRLRLSRAQEATLRALSESIEQQTPLHQIAYQENEAMAVSVMLIRAAMFEAPPTAHDWALIRKGAQAEFPVSAKDLMPGLQGPALGKTLKALEARWIASEFSLSKEALLP